MSTCVGLRYGRQPFNATIAFLDSGASVIPTCPRTRGPISSRPLAGPTAFDWHFHSPAHLAFCVPTVAPGQRYRNINLLSIDYAFRPRLRIRLTHGRTNLPQETLDYRWAGFPPALSLLMPASSLASTSRSVPLTLYRGHDAFLPLCLRRARGFGSGLESRSFSARHHSTSELLRTL